MSSDLQWVGPADAACAIARRELSPVELTRAASWSALRPRVREVLIEPDAVREVAAEFAQAAGAFATG